MKFELIGGSSFYQTEVEPPTTMDRTIFATSAAELFHQESVNPDFESRAFRPTVIANNGVVKIDGAEYSNKCFFVAISQGGGLDIRKLLASYPLPREGDLVDSDEHQELIQKICHDHNLNISVFYGIWDKDHWSTNKIPWKTFGSLSSAPRHISILYRSGHYELITDNCLMALSEEEQRTFVGAQDKVYRQIKREKLDKEIAQAIQEKANEEELRLRLDAEEADRQLALKLQAEPEDYDEVLKEDYDEVLRSGEFIMEREAEWVDDTLEAAEYVQREEAERRTRQEKEDLELACKMALQLQMEDQEKDIESGMPLIINWGVDCL